MTVIVAEWDREQNGVLSGEYYLIEDIGVFGFFVPNSRHQYLLAYSMGGLVSRSFHLKHLDD